MQGNGLPGDTTSSSYNATTQQNAAALPLQAASQGISTLQTAFGGARPKMTQQCSGVNNMPKNRSAAMMDGEMETQLNNQTQNTLVQQPVGRTEGLPTNVRQTVEWDKEGIPSLNTLRQATDINQ